MAYTVGDIIEKLILIEEAGVKVYGSISEKYKNTNPGISIISKTLCNEEKKHISYYEAIKRDIEKYKNEEIEFYLYDKAAKLLYEYMQRVQVPEVRNVKDLLDYAIAFEKNNIGLLLDIQGRLVQSPQDIVKFSYEIITKMIEEEKSHEKQLEKILEKI